MTTTLAAVAIVPDYAVEEFRNQEYAPWFLAHYDRDMLDDDIVLAHYTTFLESLGDNRNDDDHSLYYFFPWLEQQKLGYTVLETASDRYQILPVGAFDLDKNGA